MESRLVGRARLASGIGRRGSGGKGGGRMQVTVTFRNIEATDALRRYADAKLSRAVSKYFRRPLEGHVVLAVSKRRHSAEITVMADRATLNAREETGDLYSAIDLAVDKIERQAKKQKTKRRVHKSAPSAPRAPVAEIGVPSQPEGQAKESSGPPAVVRTERVAAKPMSVEEAVMQLEVSTNEFLVFRNAVNETVNVLYRRKDGNYGLIEPDVRAR
jgi:ribosome hibernation promoting factor